MPGHHCADADILTRSRALATVPLAVSTRKSRSKGRIACSQPHQGTSSRCSSLSRWPCPALAGGKKLFERPVGSVVITGELEDRVFPAHLHRLPALRRDELPEAAVRPGRQEHKLRFDASATGTDDYQAIVAWGELDPGFENKPILLAVTQDSKSLAAEGIRLVVPDDIRGGRYVSLIDTVRLDRARQPGCPRDNIWWFFRHLPKC
jgi:hypothetical protein